MALTAEATSLTAAARQRQLALRAAILRELITLWPTFDIRNIDASWEALRPAVMALINSGRVVAQALAQAYFDEFRRLEGIAGAAPTIAPLGDSWRQRALISLEVTGPSAAKALLAQARQDAAQVAFIRVSGVVSRYTLEAGRETVLAGVQEDRLSIGWQRVTDGLPCAFCAMLASRGPAYKSRQSASFDAHDHCACTVEPVYHRQSEWPGRNREFLGMWNESTRGVHGSKASQNAFRRFYEQTQLKGVS